MNKKWIWRGLEWILVLVGLTMAVDAIYGGITGSYYVYKRMPVVSFWWVVPAAMGLMLFVGGTCSIFKFCDLERSDDGNRICPTCEEVYLPPIKTKECSKCSSLLEPLVGFYKRHPELKDK